MYGRDDSIGTDSGDPTTQPTAPRLTGPITDPNDPRLTDQSYANDPAVLDYINRGLATQQVSSGNAGTPNSPEWQPYIDAANPATVTPPPGGTTGGSGNGAPQTGPGTLTGLLAPYTGTFTPPTPTPYPTAPGFTPPGYTPPPAFVPDTFTAPTYADVQNDPGYQFASDEGRRALEQGAAKNGLLNSGGTLKDILAWGGNYAAQRYGDVYKRQQDTYGLNEGAKERAYAANYSSQFLDPYKFAYQGALDTFAPKQAQWQTNMAATQRGNENDYANAYNLFNFDYNKFKDQRDSTFNKTFQYVTA